MKLRVDPRGSPSHLAPFLCPHLQENDAILIKAEDRDLLQSICDRERCLMQVWMEARPPNLISSSFTLPPHAIPHSHCISAAVMTTHNFSYMLDYRFPLRGRLLRGR